MTIYLSIRSFVHSFIIYKVLYAYLEMIIFAKKLRGIVNEKVLAKCFAISIARTNMNDHCSFLFSLTERRGEDILR